MRVATFLLSTAAATAALLGASAHASAAAFTPGDIVVYRASGTGTSDAPGSLAAAGNPIVLDEYNPTNGSLVQSIPLSTFSPGNSSSEGQMTLSSNGQYLVVTGYASDQLGTITSTNGSTDARVISILDASGSVISTTTIGETAITGNLRSAVTDNGTNIWFTGAGMGVRYVTAGSTTSDTLPSVNITGTTSSNYRQINIYGGQIYLSTNDGTPGKLNTVGTGLPTTSTQSLTALSGIPTSSLSPYQFALLDLNSSIAGVDTLYLADDTGTTGGIQKFSFNGTSWTSNGTIGAGTAIRGLTAQAGQDGSVSIFATNGNTSGSKDSIIYDVTDSAGFGSAPSSSSLNQFISIASTSSDGSLAGGYRGIAFVPTAVPEPATLSLGMVGISMLLLRRRK